MPTSKAISASKLLGKDRYEYYLNELVTEKTLGGHKLSSAQLKEAFKKRSNKISFEQFVDKVISTKTVRAAFFPGTGPVLGPAGGGLGPRGGALVKSPTGGLATYKKLQVAEDKKEIGGIGDYLKDITNSLGNIIDVLNQGISAEVKNQQQKRRDKERSKREGIEKGLEKGFAAVAKVVDKVVAPVKSILSRIIDFFLKMFLARAVVKLIDWLADPQNQGKIKSLMRFFGDHWSKLFSLYIVFGTSFGKFARGLISLVLRSTVRLGAAVAALAVKVGIGKAGGKLSKVAGFLGGKKGKLLAAGLEAAVTVGGTMALSKTLEGGLGGGEQKAQGLAGGGYVRPRFPAFKGGGFNFKGMLGGASLGSMFGPLGMLLGGALGGSGKPQEMFGGFVSGEKGVDKVPAMLSDGEFVMSRGAVAKYGVDTLESMNAAGGGTNKPKIISGTTYAVGGGFIGNPIAAQEAWTNYMKINPEKFMKGSVYGDMDSVNKASRDFMKTFMKTGQPPPWAQFVEEVEKVKNTKRTQEPSSRKSQTYSQPKSPKSSGFSWKDWWKNQTSSTPKSPPPSGSKPPTSSAITKSTGALSTEVRTPKPRVRGYGGALQAAFAAMEFNDRKQAGQTTTQAGLGAAGSALGGQVGWMAGAKAGALLGGAIGAMFAGVGAAPGAAIGAIIGGVAGGFGGASLGGKLADDLSGVNAAKERMNRGGIGGAVKGGYGLRGQSFKDAPKTMVMTDDKGRPFVGHKAMRNGKLTYVRPPTPGTGTTNPLEAIGRFVNPGAYKENDQRVAMKNQKIAMVNALESFQRQGMAPDAQARMMKQMGGNLKDVQNDLNYRRKTEQKEKEEQRRLMSANDKGGVMRRNNAARLAAQQNTKPAVKPPTRPTTNVVRIAGVGQAVSGAAAAARRRKPGTPVVSPAHPQGTRRNQAVLGIRSR